MSGMAQAMVNEVPTTQDWSHPGKPNFAHAPQAYTFTALPVHSLLFRTVFATSRRPPILNPRFHREHPDSRVKIGKL